GVSQNQIGPLISSSVRDIS
ncbi:hypothetical protein BMETH_2569309369140, partial [methanotrophic bacterial endosymbiont of Bathymodiolus sp.]